MNINAGNKNTVRRRPYLIKSAGISIIPNTRRENGHICLILRLITPMSIRKASTAETTAVSPSETQRLLFVKAMAIKKQISPKARRTTGLIIEILLPSNIFLSERAIPARSRTKPTARIILERTVSFVWGITKNFLLPPEFLLSVIYFTLRNY